VVPVSKWRTSHRLTLRAPSGSWEIFEIGGFKGMKLLNLETKTAFVTGAGSGIGQRIALGLPQDQSGQTLR
jgi:hypothetical protein